MFIPRRLYKKKAYALLKKYPVVAILGPRQCGKTTLARKLIPQKGLYLDMESPRDFRKLSYDPEQYLGEQKNLVCIDEIQRFPDLFPLLRSLVDRRRRNGQFMVLGSAGPHLLKQASESLAGRIAFLELSPFQYFEIKGLSSADFPLNSLWLRGGFPKSMLSDNEEQSHEWREFFTRTFLEMDIPQLGIDKSLPHN